MFPPPEYCDGHSTAATDRTSSSNIFSAFSLISTPLNDINNKLNLASPQHALLGTVTAMGGNQLPLLEHMSYTNLDWEYMSLNNSHIHLQEPHQISSIMINNSNSNSNNWNGSIEVQDSLPVNKPHLLHDQLQQDNYEQIPCFPPAPDLLNLLHLPPVLPQPTKKRLADFHQMPPRAAMFGAAGNGVLYNEPPLQLNFCSPPRFLRSSPAADDNIGGGGEGGGVVFGEAMEGFGRRRDGRGGNSVEKQRRVEMKHMFLALRSLVPSPTKEDKASIVAGAIDYIKELQRTVDELKNLVEKKRLAKDRRKKFKSDSDQAVAGDHMESSCLKGDEEGEHSYNAINGSLRSSWLLRKSKGTVVDVRIVDDEAIIKLTTQRRKINCLLLVTRILHELQLKLLQVAGGNIGDHYIFMFNTKISEDSTIYAGAIAKKLIEELDGQHLVTIPDAGF